MVRVIIGLGSNLGNKEQNILNAIDKMDFLSSIKKSDFFYSEALLLKDSDPSWNIPYVNAAVSGDINLSPEDLLKALKSIENNMGRDLEAPRFSPRIIDLDILFYGNQSILLKNITIPHFDFYNREFAYVPVKQIEPEFDGIDWSKISRK
jgi:2-amino-4-hydroxy-6-hydroxymethyldihydropteridine diphosphokinase